MCFLHWISDHINFLPPCYRSSSDPCSHHKMCPEGALNLGASPASRQIPKTIKYTYTTVMIFHLSMHIRYIHCINKTSFFNTFPFQSYHRERERDILPLWQMSPCFLRWGFLPIRGSGRRQSVPCCGHYGGETVHSTQHQSDWSPPQSHSVRRQSKEINTTYYICTGTYFAAIID